MPRISERPDPKEAGHKPPYHAGKQSPPGRESQMNPKADHGEESYVGNSRLTGKAAIITGVDSGMGRAAAIAFAEIAPLYVFLASQDAAYVTGEIFGATGGQTPY